MYPGVRFDTSGVVKSDYANEFQKDDALRNSRALNFSNSTGLSLLFIVLQCIILPRVPFHPAEQLENLEGAEQ